MFILCERHRGGAVMADKFLVIDGSSLVHRAFFALPPGAFHGVLLRRGVS